VEGVRFAGIETARPTAAVVTALKEADGVVIAPSNPLVSVGPILALAGLPELVASQPALAVSPIVGGEAIKGPAAKMLRELGREASPVAIAEGYWDVARGFVMDEVDAGLADKVRALGMRVSVAQTVMRSDADRASLARTCLELLGQLG
ncbi:MAG TPA: 2-phospho-L-lactate transferase CofD family protein, partial [Dehalococcoidia bacterium]|nr:2-phospho-L-lactate transferase CofD family protein [Dehalococcoidia bacterium]